MSHLVLHVPIRLVPCVQIPGRSGSGDHRAQQRIGTVKSHRGLRKPSRYVKRVVIPHASGDDDTATSSASASAVAKAFVNAQVKSNMRVGVTSGNIVALVLEEIHRKLNDGTLENVIAVPADSLAAKEAAVAGVVVSPFMQNDDGKMTATEVNVLAVQVDELVVQEGGQIAAIVGRAQRPVQPDLQTTKAMIEKATSVVLLATSSADKPIENPDDLFEGNNGFTPLGGKVPIAMEFRDKDQWDEDAENLDDMFLGDAEVWRRGAELDANPRGGNNPYISPTGTHTIVDLMFTNPLEKPPVRWEDGLVLFGEKASPARLATEIESCDGVLAHGIITDANLAYVSETSAEGNDTVRKIESKQVEVIELLQ